MSDQTQKRGGSRPGAGRKPSDNRASELVTAKLTPEQHATWKKLGASRWLKRQLDDASGPHPPQ